MKKSQDLTRRTFLGAVAATPLLGYASKQAAPVEIEAEFCNSFVELAVHGPHNVGDLMYNLKTMGIEIGKPSWFGGTVTQIQAVGRHPANSWKVKIDIEGVGRATPES